MSQKVGSLEELQAAKQTLVTVGDTEVGIFYHEGGLHAWHNHCPHMGGPVCQGRLFKKVVEILDEDRHDGLQSHHPSDMNIVCPWHGVEFDVVTGQVPANSSMCLKPAKLEVVDGNVWLHV